MLSHTARIQASWGEEDLILNAQVNFTTKGLNRCDEKAITLADWLGAAAAAEECTCFHHGTVCAKALVAHHEIVKGLTWLPNGWAVAVEYDIQQ